MTLTEGKIKRCGSNPSPVTRKPAGFAPPGQGATFGEHLGDAIMGVMVEYYKPGGEFERETARMLSAIETLSGPRLVDQFGRPIRRVSRIGGGVTDGH